MNLNLEPLNVFDLGRAIRCMDEEYRSRLASRISLARGGFPTDAHDALLHGLGESLGKFREALR